MLTPHHASLPEKTQNSENAFHSETHQPGLRVTQQLSGGSNYPGHQPTYHIHNTTTQHTANTTHIYHTHFQAVLAECTLAPKSHISADPLLYAFTTKEEQLRGS